MINRTGLADQIPCFSMAQDAIAHLREPGAMPADLILLNIKMPRVDGFEMLHAAVSEVGAAFLPFVVVMLTTPIDPADQKRVRGYSVIKGYFQKPLTVDKFTELVDTLNAARAA